MELFKKRISIITVIMVLLFSAVLTVPVGATSIDSDMFIPPEYGVISVTPEMDQALPNEEIGSEFLASPAYPIIFECLQNHEDTSKLSSEILSTILKDFEYYTSDGKMIVRDISVLELLNGLKTSFPGSIWEDNYIYCLVGNPAWKTDLKNTYNFIQAMAKRNGFSDGIPLRFGTIKISSSGGWNDSIITQINENESKIVSDTRAKTDRFRPLIGGIASETNLIQYGGLIYHMGFTTGFSVKSSNGAYGIITCGHGNPEGTNIYQPTRTSNNLIGSVTKRYLNGIDASLIMCTTGIVAKGSINGQPWNLGSEIIDVNDFGIYDSSKNFKFSGVTSGNVNGLGYYGSFIFTYPEGAIYDSQAPYILSALILNGQCNDGDSGAPVYQNYDGIIPNWNNKLVGIVSGNWSTTGPNGNEIYRTVVQPIMPILNQLQYDGYSLSVLLDGNT